MTKRIAFIAAFLIFVFAATVSAAPSRPVVRPHESAPEVSVSGKRVSATAEITALAADTISAVTSESGVSLEWLISRTERLTNNSTVIPGNLLVGARIDFSGIIRESVSMIAAIREHGGSLSVIPISVRLTDSAPRKLANVIRAIASDFGSFVSRDVMFAVDEDFLH